MSDIIREDRGIKNAEMLDWSFAPGVTLRRDGDSPTGYTVTFVYQDRDAEMVSLAGSFAFYEEGLPEAQIPAGEKAIHASDWKPGLIRAGAGDLTCEEKMTKREGTDDWMVSLSLPSGHYLYNYKVYSKYIADGDPGNQFENKPDPANAPMESSAKNGSRATLSTVDVPYDSRQGDSVDFDFAMKYPDVPAGTIEYKNYRDVDGNDAPLAVYLPHGYDKNRTEGYKVLYLNHGGGGNEMEWFSSGNVHRIFDNLIASGKVEPTIIVAMNNNGYRKGFTWNLDRINENLVNHIIPFIEESFPVGKTASDRACAGLSMGGMITSSVLYASGDRFGYLGIFSGAVCSGNPDKLDRTKIDNPVIMLGAGCYDFGYRFQTAEEPAGAGGLPALLAEPDALGGGQKPDGGNVGKGGFDWSKLDLPQLIRIFADGFTGVENYRVYLEGLGVACNRCDPDGSYVVDGAHDWTTWSQLIKIFAEKYLWK